MAEAAQRATISVDPSSGLFLNAAILDFGDAAVEVDVLPRASDLRELRKTHRATHVLRAEHDELLAVPIITGAPRLSEKSKVVSLRENPDFACHLWARSAATTNGGTRSPARAWHPGASALGSGVGVSWSGAWLGEQEHAPFASAVHRCPCRLRVRRAGAPPTCSTRKARLGSRGCHRDLGSRAHHRDGRRPDGTGHRPPRRPRGHAGTDRR